MGCWNGTDIITHLPILYRNDVYVFLLVEHDFIESYCYPDSHWSLVPLYFKGKYDDYGSVEDCYGPTLNMIIKEIRERLVEMPQGKNEFHDIPVTKKELDTKLLFNADHEGRLFIHGAYDKHKQKRIKHVIARKETIDLLLQHFTIGNGLTYDAIVNNGLIFIDKAIAKKDELSVFGFWSTDYKDVFARLLDGARGHYNTLFSARNVVEQVFTDYRYNQKEETRELLYEIVRQVCLTTFLDIFMMHGRRTWVPPSGNGSQDTESTVQELNAFLILEMARRRIEEMEE